MNTTYLRIELRRTVRNYVTIFFVAVLPAFFYLIFGASQDYADESAGNGNVALYIMISMAAYGAVTATTGIGGMSAVERMQGWGRQLGITPMTDRSYVTVKALVALAIAAVPVLLVFGLGWLTGAEGTAGAWLGAGLILLSGATMFSLYGLIFGLAFRSESAVSAASGSLVILAFLGNIFFPLSGWLLILAKFTPLYGYVALAHYPLTSGVTVSAAGSATTEPLWQSIANVAVWTVIFALLATWLVRRGRGRQ